MDIDPQASGEVGMEWQRKDGRYHIPHPQKNDAILPDSFCRDDGISVLIIRADLDASQQTPAPAVAGRDKTNIQQLI